MGFGIAAPGFLWAEDSPTILRELRKDEIISPEALRELQLSHADFVLFDARSKNDYEREHIVGAVLPLSLKYYNDLALFVAKILPDRPDPQPDLAVSTQKYPKDKPIVTYCNRDCKAGTALLIQLKKVGFTNVRVMEKGLQAWEEMGYPVERGSNSGL